MQNKICNDGSPQPNQTPHQLRDRLLCGAFFSVGMLLSVMPYFGWNFRCLPGSNDTIFNSLVFEHGYLWLSGLRESFWSPSYFFPAPSVLAYSDSHIGNLPVIALLRCFFSLETTVAMWIILQFVLNYGVCVGVLRKWNFSVIAACAGAYFFTFALPVTAQFAHIQLLPRFAGVLALYFAREFWLDRSWRSFGAVLLFLIWQFLCSIYLGSIFLLTLIIYFLFLAVIEGKQQNWRLFLRGNNRREFICRIVCAALAAALLWKFLQPYHTVWVILNKVKPQSILAFSPPQIWSYLLPSPDSPVYHWLFSVNPIAPLNAEHSLFPGLAAVIALCAAIWIACKDRNRELTVVLLVTATLIVFSLQLGPFCLSQWFCNHVPGFNSLRSIARIILVLLFGGAVCIAFLIDRLPINNLLKTIFLILLLADSIILSTSNRLDPQDWRHDEALLADQLKNVPPKSVFIYVPQKCDSRTQLIAMQVAQQLDLSTVNGYSGHNPPGWFIWGMQGSTIKHDLNQWLTLSYKIFATDQNKDMWKQNIILVGDLSDSTPPPPSGQ